MSIFSNNKIVALEAEVEDLRKDVLRLKSDIGPISECMANLDQRVSKQDFAIGFIEKDVAKIKLQSAKPKEEAAMDLVNKTKVKK